MSDMITAEEAGKLLDGLGSREEAWVYDAEDSRVRVLDHTRHEICWDSTDADGAMLAAAPDLARTVIALHAQLADAKAAQAMAQALRAERDELAKVIDDTESRYGLSSNGNMWRFWSDKAREIAGNNTELRADRDRLAAELAAAQQREADYQTALIWCSGSDDFQSDGKAREGWLKLCAPLIQPAAMSNNGRGE